MPTFSGLPTVPSLCGRVPQPESSCMLHRCSLACCRLCVVVLNVPLIIIATRGYQVKGTDWHLGSHAGRQAALGAVQSLCSTARDRC